MKRFGREPCFFIKTRVVAAPSELYTQHQQVWEEIFSPPRLPAEGCELAVCVG